MSFGTPSIPSPFQADFSISSSMSWVPLIENKTVIKDFDDQHKTPMLQKHEIAVRIEEAWYAQAQDDYKQTFQDLSTKAIVAKEEIGSARVKKAIAVTCVVATVIGAVGLIVAGAATGMLPLFLAAIPLFIGIAPSAIATRATKQGVARLEREIEAPYNLPVPKKMLPIYHKEHDLDLKSSRLAAINKLAGMSLQDIANSKWTAQELIDYRLLDQTGKFPENQRSAFYGKSIRLINDCRDLKVGFGKEKAKVDGIFNAKMRELEGWHAQEISSIDSHAYDIQRRRSHQYYVVPDRHHRGHAMLHNTFTMIDAIDTNYSMNNLNQRREEVASTYGYVKGQLNSWRDQAQMNVTEAYKAALGSMEAQFKAA